MSLRSIANMKASEAGSPSVPSLDKDYSLAEILKSIEKAKTDRAFLTEDGKARGVLTFRDVLDKIATARTKQASIGGLHGSSFMNEPVKHVSPKDKLETALRLMVDGLFTSVPVVDDGVIEAAITRYELASIIRDTPYASDVQAKDIMKTFLVSASLQTRILHIRQLIYEYDVSLVPIIEEGRFSGVVGLDELLNVIMAFYSLQKGEPKRHTPLKYVVAADAVRLRPPTLPPDASVADAADQIVRTRYRAVVIVDRDKPVGYISGLELAGFLLTRPV